MAFENFNLILATLKKKIIFLMALVGGGGFMVSWPFLNDLINYIKSDLISEGAVLIVLTPLEVMLIKIKVSLMIGLICAAPLAGHYAYKVLKSRFKTVSTKAFGKGAIIYYTIFSVALFASGIFYAYFVMLRFLIDYLFKDAQNAGAIVTYSVAEFMSFVILSTIIFGLAFELPIILTILVKTGMVRYELLKKYRKHAYIVILIISAMVTSPDIFTQLMIGVPLVIFYEISVFTVRFTARSVIKERAMESEIGG